MENTFQVEFVEEKNGVPVGSVCSPYRLWLFAEGIQN
jgi:hypothetical protein